jgi:hypothetical protein
MTEPVITPDLVAAYAVCRRRAFLVLQGESGHPHAYAQVVKARTATYREAYLESFETGGLRVHEGQKAMAAGADVIANLTFRSDHLEATADALVRTVPDLSKKRPWYEPHLVLGTLPLQAEATATERPTDGIRVQR